MEREMPRANRYYISGHAWHLTHRCHKREYLLKFARDRQVWIHWLFEAKKRYGLTILNYTVTSNHIHLLVYDQNGGDTIPKSIQLIAGRTAQEYNQRKNRNGAFWEDRYHATAVQTDIHLLQCLVYIDLNMVRAGVVKHPCDWPYGGYREIQKNPKRYRLIDREVLMRLLGIKDSDQLALSHRRWVERMLQTTENVREERWTESVAVGNLYFIEDIKEKLGERGVGRKVVERRESCELRECQFPYNGESDPENPVLRLENEIFWDDSQLISTR